MEEYFCEKCGTKLIGFQCPNGHSHENTEHNTKYVEKELDKNSTKWVEQWNRWRNDRQYKSSYYFCHTCHHFMHHQKQHCHKCGNRLSSEILSTNEMVDKYPNYRRGC